jgi:HEPN domain-containing protein
MNPLDPHDWFTKADRDFGLASYTQLHKPEYPDLICYHCQQAAEKFLKALVIHHGLPLRKTHDLEELLDILTAVESSINQNFYYEALKIKNYAVGIRYPDPSGDPTEADVAEALLSAEFFRNFAAATLKI